MCLAELQRLVRPCHASLLGGHSALASTTTTLEGALCCAAQSQCSMEHVLKSRKKEQNSKTLENGDCELHSLLDKHMFASLKEEPLHRMPHEGCCSGCFGCA